MLEVLCSFTAALVVISSPSQDTHTKSNRAMTRTLLTSSNYAFANIELFLWR